jgi:YD repeat-containing protein
MMIPRFMVVALCVLGPLTCVAHGGNINGEATYVSFFVPGGLGTYPMSINASMEVTGYYNVSATGARGFLREADGTITTFNVPGAVWTEPEGINAAGNITGFYELVAGIPRGFLRYADGRLITFDPPPPVEGMALQSQPISISDFDDIAGTYLYAWLNFGTTRYPPQPAVFTRSRAGVFNTIPPTSTFGPGFSSFWATAINGSGAVVGYFTGDPLESGFVAHPDGYFGQFTVPQTLYCDIGQATIPEGINAGGTIAGWYTNCNAENNLGGFVMSPDGNLTLFKPAGTILTSALPQTTPYTQPQDPPYLESLTAPRVLSIDQAGDITGSYTDAAGVQHGFVRNPYGNLTSFDPPEGNQTTATSISDGGAIAGFYHYLAGGGPPVGFIRVP